MARRVVRWRLGGLIGQGSYLALAESAAGDACVATFQASELTAPEDAAAAIALDAQRGAPAPFQIWDVVADAADVVATAKRDGTNTDAVSLRWVMATGSPTVTLISDAYDDHVEPEPPGEPRPPVLPDWDENEVEEALGAFLVGLAPDGTQVYWANQDDPMPDPPVVVLQWLPDLVMSPMAERRKGHDDGEWVDVDQHQAVLQVDVYAGTRGKANARAIARQIRSRLALEDSIVALAAIGFAVIDRRATRETSAIVEVASEGRATLELKLGYALAESQNLSWIDTIEPTGTYEE